jgi:hypothetical protein
MFDSTSARDIPVNAQLVAGYGNGRYLWAPSDWHRFPPATHVVISVNAWYPHAIVLDVEGGDATPEQANGWIIASQATTGWVPTLYGTRATLDRCRRLANIGHLDCDFWLAEWTGIPHLPPGFAACQYAAPGHGSPGHFDMSVVADNWPRPVARPKLR